MMKTFFICSTFLLLGLSGCQSQKNSDHNNLETNNEVLGSSNTTSSYSNFLLPSYEVIQPDSSNENSVVNTVSEYQARKEGRLTIRNGCVSLTYPPEKYPEAKKDYSVILIFSSDSKFVNNGNAVEVNGATYKDGDYVEMSGTSTVRDFYKSLPDNATYNPVPEHCHAVDYWEVGGSGLRKLG